MKWSGCLSCRVLLMTLIFAIGCHDEKVPQKNVGQGAPVKVSTMTVHVQQGETYERIPGSVHPATEATIEAKLSGRIVKLLVREGDAIKEKQLLVELDSHEMQAKLDQAIAAQRQAQRDLTRLSELLPRGAVTRQEYDAAEARARVADAGVTEAQTMVGYGRIEAPFDGVVTRKLANEGDFSLPGKPILMVEKRDLYRFEADVPETLAGTLKNSAALSVQLSGLDQGISGTVSEISPTTDPNSRTLHIKLDLPSDPVLRSGQFGYVSVPVRDRPQIIVPPEAVIERGQIEAVFVVQDNTAELRLVRTGKKTATGSVILAGLSDSEMIVTSNPQQLTDGVRVEVTP